MRPFVRLGALPVSILLLSTAIAQDTSNGLKVEVTAPASCTRKTQKGDTIHVNYRGTLESDGTEFDSSYGFLREPFTFVLGAHQVIKGWDQGLLDMCIGEGRRLIIPPVLGYGDRGQGKIPAGSTLVFETELMGIDGVKKELAPTPSKTADAVASSASSSALSSESFGLVAVETATADAGKGSEKGPKDGEDKESGECKLLGPFALLVQGALGILALLSLVWKRYRETPRRPLKVWSFDASKQVVGSALLHLANLLMSMLSSGDFDLAQKAQQASTFVQDDRGRKPNPCSFYLLNLAIDTTIGIPILVGLLRLLHIAFSHTSLAQPEGSLRSGNYGNPPRATWWLKQSFVYFLGLLGMKLCVFFLFQLLPWLGWVGDWALRWTEGKEWMQITFVMLIFPLIMNALQYYIIDSFIKDKAAGTEENNGDIHEEEHEGLIGAHSEDDASSEGTEEAQRRGKRVDVRTKEANPTPLPVEYDPETDGAESSSFGRDSREENKK